MLFTDIMEPQSKLVYPDGYAHDRSLDGLRERVKTAEVYVLDEQACAMAANVSVTKPSSILAALPFVKLPFERIWIEFANQHVRAATADLGSPNIRDAEHQYQIVRTGFLLYMDVEAQDIVVEYVHRDRTPNGDEATDMAPVIGRFSLATTDEYSVEEYPSLPRTTEVVTTGKFREYQKTIDKNPAEAAAQMELRNRLRTEPHPDAQRLIRSVESLMGRAGVDNVLQGQAGDLSRNFGTMILTALILLNCRNAVDQERVPAPDKLNKKRLQKGRPPILEYRMVKIHLSGNRRRALSRQGVSTAATTGALVIGHFKVRKSGIYWWGFHMRNGGPAGVGPRRVNVMTA